MDKKVKHKARPILSLQRKAGFIGPDFVEIKWCFDTERNRAFMLKRRDSWRKAQPNDEFEVVRIKRVTKYKKL